MCRAQSREYDLLCNISVDNSFLREYGIGVSCEMYVNESHQPAIQRDWNRTLTTSNIYSQGPAGICIYAAPVKWRHRFLQCGKIAYCISCIVIAQVCPKGILPAGSV